MPNIAIYEGGKAARMNGVSRITTDDGNDGKTVWVPQSDRQTGTLYVSENGTYRAEDEGLHSWSKVTVRLAGAPLGLEVPTLPPAGLEPIEDEVISSDEAEKILEEAGLDPSDLESDDAMEAIADALGTDPDNVKVVDTGKKEDVKEAEPKVKDKGQKAVGTDPNTGEQTTITPSGKETEPEAVGIEIVKYPLKMAYTDGETIDYGYMEIALLDANGRTIETVKYPDSGIGTPVTTASLADSTGQSAIYEDITVPISYSGTYYTYIPFSYSNRDIYSEYIYTYACSLTPWEKNNQGSIWSYLLASSSPSVSARRTYQRYIKYKNGTTVYDDPVIDESDEILRGSYSYMGKTVHYGGNYASFPSGPTEIGPSGSPSEELLRLGAGMTAWVMVYGNITAGFQTIPVTYRGFETSMTISVR